MIVIRRPAETDNGTMQLKTHAKTRQLALPPHKTDIITFPVVTMCTVQCTSPESAGFRLDSSRIDHIITLRYVTQDAIYLLHTDNGFRPVEESAVGPGVNNGGTGRIVT